MTAASEAPRESQDSLLTIDELALSTGLTVRTGVGRRPRLA